MTKWEYLSKDYKIKVSKEHCFNTDTILLADFSKPKKNNVCADFGTGCGTIAMLWAIRQNPKKIYAVELQEKAFNQFKDTIKENKIETIELIKADLKEYKSIFGSGSLDHIACNPPYFASGAGIKNNVKNMTIARHEEELTIEDLAKAVKFSLKFGGKFFLCQRPDRLTDVICTLREYGIEPKKIRFVSQYEGKAPSLFLLECRRGGNSGIEVQNTLYIEENGEFSKEMLEIYGEYKEGHIG